MQSVTVLTSPLREADKDLCVASCNSVPVSSSSGWGPQLLSVPAFPWSSEDLDSPGGLQLHVAPQSSPLSL